MQTATKTPIYRSIADELRTRVGGHQAGDLFPSEVLLAEQFDVNARTVRQALDVLVREGWIRRHRGRGTVVVDRHATGEFAVAIWPHLLRSDASPYFGMVCNALAREIQGRNPRWSVKLHAAQVDEWEGQLPISVPDLLEPSVLARLRGVFSFSGMGGLDDQLTAAGVPVIYFNGAETPSQCSIEFDWKTLYAMSLAQLRESGCRRIATLRLREWLWPEEAFASELRANGLETRPEWTLSGRFDARHDPEQSGYDAFMSLWDQPEHPDGLLVMDDILCRGVLRAILQRGIKVPDTLRLISHSTRGVAFPYHLPVTRVEYDPAELARQAVEMMTVLMSGRVPPVRTLHLAGKLVKGETA